MTAGGPGPILNDRRRVRRLAADPVCVCCGDPNGPLEQHHLFGVANEPDLELPLCRCPCHRRESEGQLIYGVSLRHGQALVVPEQVASHLRALGGSFLFVGSPLGERLLDWAERLIALTEALDGDYPDWRRLPEAKR